MYRLTGTASSKRSGASEVQLLANLAGKSEGQAFQYLHSLSELTIAKQMVSLMIVTAAAVPFLLVYLTRFPRL